MRLLLKSTSSSWDPVAVEQEVLQHCKARYILHGASDLTFNTGFRGFHDPSQDDSTEKLSLNDSYSVAGIVPTTLLSQPMSPSAGTVLFEK